MLTDRPLTLAVEWGSFSKALRGQVMEYAIRFNFRTTNNEVEYEAAIAGLKLCRAAGGCRVNLLTDSKLFAGQIGGKYKAREESTGKYLEAVKEMLRTFLS